MSGWRHPLAALGIAGLGLLPAATLPVVPARAVAPDIATSCGALYAALARDALAKATAFRWVLSSTSADGLQFFVTLQVTTDAGILSYSGFHCAMQGGRLVALPYRRRGSGDDDGQGKTDDQ